MCKHNIYSTSDSLTSKEVPVNQRMCHIKTKPTAKTQKRSTIQEKDTRPYKIIVYQTKLLNASLSVTVIGFKAQKYR